MRMYPMALKVAGRRCVVIGGGAIAARKAASLLDAGAHVSVISPELCPILEERAARSEISAERRAFQPGDLDGALVAIAATNNRAVNEAIAAEARAKGVLLNVVDVPDLCDFFVPASIHHGDLEVTVSTGGAFPALAKRMRMALERQFGPEYGLYLALLEEIRSEIKAQAESRPLRNQIEEALLDVPALLLLAEGRHAEAERLLRECVRRMTGEGAGPTPD